MDGTCENAADRDDDKRDLSELDAGDDTDDRTYAGDVEKLDQEVLPLGQDHVIDSVGLRYGRRRPVIRSNDPLYNASVREVPGYQKDNS